MSIAQGGAIGLLGWVARLLYVGRLLTRSTVDAMLASEQRRADDWRTAYERELARGAERDAQLSHILAAVKP